MTAKAQATKEKKSDNQISSKFETFVLQYTLAIKIPLTYRMGENIYKISDKVLVSRIYKESLLFNNKKKV